MNGEKYIEILRDYLIPEIQTARATIDVNFKLMHDNAPCHRARSVKEYLEQEGVEFMAWSAYSPDMNPIENVWAWVKQKLYSNYPLAGTREELIRFVFEIWGKITPELVRQYCAEYGKRLLALKNANGGHTKY